VIERVLVAVVAVALLAWLGVMERDLRLQERGAGAAQRGDFERAESALRSARLLNPDPAPDVRRALLYQGSGRPAEAVKLLEHVLRREPDNLDAWGLLYAFTRDRDPAAAEAALEQRHRLDPLAAGGG